MINFNKIIRLVKGIILMNKGVLIAACLLAQNTVFASSLYAGLDIGYQVLSNTSGGIRNDEVFSTYRIANNLAATTQGNGVIGGAFLGYEKPLNHKFLLAVEANIETMRSHVKQYDDAFISNNNVKQIQVNSGFVESSENLALGIVVKPALMLNHESRIYATLGYEAGHFQGSDSYVLVQGSESDSYKSMTGAQWLNGFRYGLGTQMDCTKQLSLRLEVNQTQYPTLKGKNYYNLATGDTLSGGMDFKYKTLEAMVGAVWHFEA